MSQRLFITVFFDPLLVRSRFCATSSQPYLNRFTLNDSDTAQFEFGGQVKGKHYQITILVVEDLPQIFIKQDGEVFFNETVKSIDDLKIFLEERLYKYLEV
jgi:hypothetical protein